MGIFRTRRHMYRASGEVSRLFVFLFTGNKSDKQLWRRVGWFGDLKRRICTDADACEGDSLPHVSHNLPAVRNSTVAG